MTRPASGPAKRRDRSGSLFGGPFLLGAGGSRDGINVLNRTDVLDERSGEVRYFARTRRVPMNWKTIVPLVIALGLGGIAAKVGKDMIAKGRQGDVKTIKVVAAKEDLSPGAMIKETDVVLRELPAAAVSEHSFANVSDLVGRVVTAQVSKGQPVLETLLAPKGALGG